MKKILVIDEDIAFGATLDERLGGAFTIIKEQCGEKGLRAFEAEAPNIVILAVKLPDMDGLRLLDKLRIINENACVIMTSSGQDMETTVEAMKKGAFDCVSKPVNLPELEFSIKKAFQNIELHGRLKDLLADVYRDYKVDTIIGKNRAMEEIFK